jgi:hypothetical protein
MDFKKAKNDRYKKQKTVPIKILKLVLNSLFDVIRQSSVVPYFVPVYKQ